MPTDCNLSFIRSCAKHLGATDEVIDKLEKAEHRATNDWDEDQAARFWNRGPGPYLADLGITPEPKLQRGDRVLYMQSIDSSRPWTIVACGPKRVTIAREKYDDGSPFGAGGERENLHVDTARRTLIPFPKEHEAAVVGFVVGYQARSALRRYFGFVDKLSTYVTFRCRLAGLLSRLEKTS